MQRKRFVVTGGGGFVGKALCMALREQGHEVWAASRGNYPELEDHGINSVQVDLSSDPEKMWAPEFWAALEGAHTVFHVAAKVDMWGSYHEFFRSNVLSTRQLLSACRKLGIKHFVYTSSPSVIASGADLRGVNESHPYPGRYLANYPRTKAMAEREVLAANGTQGVFTCALRPHLVWGPGDTHLIPTIVARARAGKLIRVGSGRNMVDTCYIDDCVAAHLCASEALEQNPAVRGRAFFISQGEPVPLWGWIDQVLHLHNLPPITRRIPKAAAYAIASILERVAKFRPGQPEPLFTRFLVSEMSTDHYFDIGNARRLLGYVPRYSMAQAMELMTRESVREAGNF